MEVCVGDVGVVSTHMTFESAFWTLGFLGVYLWVA
jgi:hypothetical protein